MIDWKKCKVSKHEDQIIFAIADRAVLEAADLGVDIDRMTVAMDLLACHCCGCPLDLYGLLTAKLPDFCHDVFGINKYLDRETGELTECFLPRYALPEGK